MNPLRSIDKAFVGSGLQRVPRIINFSFSSQSPPDVGSNTRIIVVCGPDNSRVTQSLGGWASPVHDGWFFSDFFLFHALLHEAGAASTFMSCVSPRELLEEYGEYLHGNPYEERKVVFDRYMFEQGWFDGIKVYSPADLKLQFLVKLHTECNEARRLGQQVTVIMLGHGHLHTRGVYLGPRSASSITTQEEFASAAGKELQICVVSTACHSGAWAISPDFLNATTMTAAHAYSMSESWNASKSVGRACGSIFSSALITASDRIEGVKAYSEYAQAVINVCTYETDRLQDQALCFSAQDDMWEISWQQRTGIPLDKFRSRWNQLMSVAPAYGDFFLNRDASRYNPDGSFKPVSKDMLDHGFLSYEDSQILYDRMNPYLPSNDQGELQPHAEGGLTGRGNFGGEGHSEDPLHGLPRSLRARFATSDDGSTMAQFRRFVHERIEIYRACFPGKPNIATNMQLEAFYNKLRRGVNVDFTELRGTLTQLQYRMELLEHANRLCQFLGLGGIIPKIHTIDMDEWLKRHEFQKRPGAMQAYSYALSAISKHEIFGTPLAEQGREFFKPMQYLAAALSYLDRKQIDDAIANMIHLNNESITHMRVKVEQSSKVREKKRTLTNTMRARFTGSPPKRRRMPIPDLSGKVGYGGDTV